MEMTDRAKAEALEALAVASAAAKDRDRARWEALRRARAAGASLRELAEASGLNHEQVRYRLKREA